MNQHTYSFPKVTPVDPEELREGIRSSRRDLTTTPDETVRTTSLLRALRIRSKN
ncbi:MAG: hypothetical protein ITG02_05405 [Patulibacter sp.]|nr:hypothetical protein [Patulibacter sp.]